MIAVEFFDPENGSHVTVRFVRRVNARIFTQTNKEEGGPGIQVWVCGPLQCTGKFRRGKGESERRCSLKCYHLMSLFIQTKSPKRTHWTLNPVCADLQWLIMLTLFRKGAELTRLSRDIYKFCFDFINLSTCWITFLLINIHFPPLPANSILALQTPRTQHQLQLWNMWKLQLQGTQSLPEALCSTWSISHRHYALLFCIVEGRRAWLARLICRFPLGMEARSRHALPGDPQHGSLRQRHADRGRRLP